MANLIGLDVVLDASETIYKETGEAKYGQPIIRSIWLKRD